MYVYDQYDQKIVDERVAQYRDQTDRFLAGKLTEAEFLPLRLQNGLYVQRLAPMLRIAVPYGLMNSTQLRKLAQISRDYDKGYAHISTRQNIQLNWPQLAEVPDILAELATVQMHAIQTSGNCIRNTTTDQFAGVAAMNWKTPPLLRNHPPMVNPAPGIRLSAAQIQDRSLRHDQDRAAIHAHDIGIELVPNAAAKSAARYWWRRPGAHPGDRSVDLRLAGEETPADLPGSHPAGLQPARPPGQQVQGAHQDPGQGHGCGRFPRSRRAGMGSLERWAHHLTDEEMARAQSFFTAPDYRASTGPRRRRLQRKCTASPFWQLGQTQHQRTPGAGYRIVNISLKATGFAPGDITDEQLELVADLADRYSFGEIRSTHQQNLVLADVRSASCTSFGKLAGRRPGHRKYRLPDRYDLLPRRRLLLTGQRQVTSRGRSHPGAL